MKSQSRLTTRATKPINYAVGMFGTSIPINMFKTYAFIFYVDKLSAITADQFALILAIYTVVDAIDNPIYGFLSDRTRSPWGRRRPWLVIGAPLLALFFILFFSPPDLTGTPIFVYALLMYIMTGTLDSLINSNYGALFPELFRTEEERAKTNALRQVFQLLAMIISIALTPIITDWIGYQMTAIVYGMMAVVVIWYMAFNSHETPEAQEMPKPNFFEAVLAIVKNPKFWLYGLTNAAFFAAFSVLQQSVSFYAKYVLGATSGTTSTIMLGTVILIAIAAIPVWVKIIRRIHLMKAWRLSLIIVGVSLIPLNFTNTLATSLISLVILGFGYGGTSATMDIVSARILDEDTARYNIRREGTFSSLTGVLNKTSGLFAAIGFALVSNLFGYVNGDNPGPQPESAARFLISQFPLVIMVICVILSFFLRFPDEEAKAAHD